VRVAIFDFDGTVYSKETFQLLMEQLKNHPIYKKRYNRFFRAILPIYIGYKIKVYPKHKMRERSMRLYLEALKDLTADELDLFFKGFSSIMQKDFNQDVVSRIKKHAADDLTVILVSGAFTPLLQAVTIDLPFDNVIGTDIPLKEHTIDTKSELFYVQGTKKNESVHALFKNIEVDWENSFSYGDSFSDLSVLELVGNPVAVKPEKSLRSVAENRDWEIM